MKHKIQNNLEGKHLSRITDIPTKGKQHYLYTPDNQVSNHIWENETIRENDRQKIKLETRHKRHKVKQAVTKH